MELTYGATLSDDRKLLNVRVGKCLFAANPKHLEGFMRFLSKHRAEMEPQVPVTHATHVGVMPAQVFAQPNEARGGVTMAIRHPGYGWIYVEVSPETLAHLVPALQAAPKRPDSSVN